MILRKEVAAELAEELQRSKRAEADTREAQSALEVQEEEKRADQTRMASLEEMKKLSLVVSRMESEGNYLVSIFFHGVAGGQPFSRQEGQLGMWHISQRAGWYMMDAGRSDGERLKPRESGGLCMDRSTKP